MSNELNESEKIYGNMNKGLKVVEEKNDGSQGK